MKAEIRFEFIKTNGITLHVARAGNPEDPLVIFLHGFPEFWISFKKQIDPIIDAGQVLKYARTNNLNVDSATIATADT